MAVFPRPEGPALVVARPAVAIPPPHRLPVRRAGLVRALVTFLLAFVLLAPGLDARPFAIAAPSPAAVPGQAAQAGTVGWSIGNYPGGQQPEMVKGLDAAAHGELDVADVEGDEEGAHQDLSRAALVPSPSGRG